MQDLRKRTSRLAAIALVAILGAGCDEDRTTLGPEGDGGNDGTALTADCPAIIRSDTERPGPESPRDFREFCLLCLAVIGLLGIVLLLVVVVVFFLVRRRG